MFLLPGRLSIPEDSKELDNIRNYTDYNGEIKQYSIFIGDFIKDLIERNTSKGKIRLGESNGLFSIELDLGGDGEVFNIGENTYIRGTEIDQKIIFDIEPLGYDREDKNGYISPKLDNHPTDLNGLRQLDEDIYLFSMNKRQAIFTSKFEEKINYIEINGINYAIGKSSISGFIWVYSLNEDKWITTDKDKILKIRIDNKCKEKYLKVKKEKGLKIGPFIMWEYF